MNTKLLMVGLTTTLLFSVAQADLFGVYSNIRTYAITDDGAPDTHQYFEYSAVPSFAGHSEATFSDGLFGASAVGDTFVTYGSLHENQVGSSYSTTGRSSVATVTNDGNAGAAYFDRLYINGANTGAQITIHCHGWLSDVTRVSGNHWAAWNVPQGLNGGIQVSGYSTVLVQDYNASTDVHMTGPQFFDVVGTVGSFLDISSYLDADLDTIDTCQGSVTAFAQTTGTLHSTFTSADSNVTITSASGHNYAEVVPEPTSVLAVGIGAIGVLCRRKLH